LANDRELWERICRGDSEAFDSFYRENGPRLRSFLRQLLGSPQTAEDVMQETFLELWRKPNGFHPENGALRTYVFGIGRKRAAEWWRQAHPVGDIKRECVQRATAESTSLVSDVFSRIEEEQRSLLWLREVESFSYVELAHILGIPVGTVRSRLFAAREALRKIWHEAPQARKEGA